MPALEKIDAVSPEEANRHCKDCLIPSVKELINDAGDFETINSFVGELDALERRGASVLYKAVLEVLHPSDLKSATELMAHVGEYVLDNEMSGPEDYAKDYLRQLSRIDERVSKLWLGNMYDLGRQIMKLDNAEMTSYGIIKRLDGELISKLSLNNGPGMKTE